MKPLKKLLLLQIFDNFDNILVLFRVCVAWFICLKEMTDSLTSYCQDLQTEKLCERFLIM